MKIVFLSNYFNHHQEPFSDEMFVLLGEDYCFIEAERMEQERVALGWQMKNLPQYVLQLYVDAEKCQSKINSADVVITGSAPEYLLNYRKKNNLLIIRYSERPLKKIPSCFEFSFLGFIGVSSTLSFWMIILVKEYTFSSFFFSGSGAELFSMILYNNKFYFSHLYQR